MRLFQKLKIYLNANYVYIVKNISVKSLCVGSSRGQNVDFSFPKLLASQDAWKKYTFLPFFGSGNKLAS